MAWNPNEIFVGAEEKNGIEPTKLVEIGGAGGAAQPQRQQEQEHEQQNRTSRDQAAVCSSFRPFLLNCCATDAAQRDKNVEVLLKRCLGL